MCHTPSFENFEFSNILTIFEHFDHFRTFWQFSNIFPVFLTRDRSNPKMNPGFGFRTQKVIHDDMPHAYILSFFEKSKKSIYRLIDIDFRKKETGYIFLFFILYPTHQRSSKSDVVCVPELWSRTDRQSHKAFFLPTCLNIFRSVYGTRFARSSKSTGDYEK